MVVLASDILAAQEAMDDEEESRNPSSGEKGDRDETDDEAGFDSAP